MKFTHILQLVVSMQTLLAVSIRADLPGDGIFAAFQTSQGGFTCRLDYVSAPLTAANFISLAEGTRGWMDEPTGAVSHQPFYSGIVFHRAIAGFMIQAGSRNGLGTDGPGYFFPDEIPNGLPHDEAGVLSMANTGFDSNGSQFFITVDATPWLDNLHTVFGKVVSGMDVVLGISQVATQLETDRPIEDVVIQSVTIHRIGDAAQAFDPAPYLPQVRQSRIRGLAIESADHHLTFNPQIFGEYFVRISSNLSLWESIRYDLFLSTPISDQIRVGVPESTSTLFYGLTEILYPGN
ncbi:MAG: peptidylprolyl isomerase, partial [Kiritimatiellia bacterium]|nr:peptidylprolyl isomerase [Kiritimatiellia bacterium]